jgi:2-deoxy-D-gluconate 3-dehydrogenase
MFDLTDRVALITGGNNGIGRAIALAYAEAGAAVAIFSRNEERNQKVLAELKALGRPALGLSVDVSDRAQLQPAFETVEQQLGPVSILVNNAGAAAFGGVLTLEVGEWDRIVETNLTSAFLLSKFAARSMVKQGRGKIINVASSSIVYGWARSPAYAVSKAALVHLTKCLAVELGPFNVQANAIMPGWVDTDLAQGMKNGPFYEQTVGLIPAGRWAKPEEMAGTAVYLASAASDYVTGTTVSVDGGLTLTYGALPLNRSLPDF